MAETVTETLVRLARRAADPEYDPRHAVLDVAPELVPLDPSGLPPRTAAELRDLIAEVRGALPLFPSRRATSPLFDRAGHGRAGLERATRLVRRLVALAEVADRATKAGTEPRPSEGGREPGSR